MSIASQMLAIGILPCAAMRSFAEDEDERPKLMVGEGVLEEMSTH